ncbi:MAG TPA: hypothetical protein VFY28_00175 [Candidatus Paceibacterota bacterium]|nr:hypothetical protein [Candidatus Paceibacterota bacterium]
MPCNHPIIAALGLMEKPIEETKRRSRPRMVAMVALIGGSMVGFLLAIGLEEYARPFLNVTSAFLSSFS